MNFLIISIIIGALLVLLYLIFAATGTIGGWHTGYTLFCQIEGQPTGYYVNQTNWLPAFKPSFDRLVVLNETLVEEKCLLVGEYQYYSRGRII